VLTIGPREWVGGGIIRHAKTTFGSEVWAQRQQVGSLTTRSADVGCFATQSGPGTDDGPEKAF
jgi:hypothetical protein